VVSPPISLRRIDRYDGQRVAYHYRSHKSERVERETVDVYTFIGRMIQHVFPKGFQRVRYYGVQATKTFEKIKYMIQEALATVKGIVKGAIKIIAPMTYRQRYRQSTGRDPLRCPHCHSDMGVWRIWHPTYGVIHDELDSVSHPSLRKMVTFITANRTITATTVGVSSSNAVSNTSSRRKSGASSNAYW
jgi:Putative transposase